MRTKLKYLHMSFDSDFDFFRKLNTWFFYLLLTRFYFEQNIQLNQILMRLVVNMSLPTFGIVLRLKVSYETSAVLIFTEFEKSNPFKFKIVYGNSSLCVQNLPDISIRQLLPMLSKIKKFTPIFFLHHKIIQRLL